MAFEYGMIRLVYAFKDADKGLNIEANSKDKIKKFLKRYQKYILDMASVQELFNVYITIKGDRYSINKEEVAFDFQHDWFVERKFKHFCKN
jgi:hypothetical protein